MRCFPGRLQAKGGELHVRRAVLGSEIEIAREAIPLGGLNYNADEMILTECL